MYYYLGPGYDLGVLKIPLHNNIFLAEAESIGRGSHRCITIHYQAVTYLNCTQIVSPRTALSGFSKPSPEDHDPPLFRSLVRQPTGNAARLHSNRKSRKTQPFKPPTIPTPRSPAQRHLCLIPAGASSPGQVARWRAHTHTTPSHPRQNPQATMSYFFPLPPGLVVTRLDEVGMKHPGDTERPYPRSSKVEAAPGFGMRMPHPRMLTHLDKRSRRYPDGDHLPEVLRSRSPGAVSV